jgi:predicted transposase/invertase (TIGR01784 family)
MENISLLPVREFPDSGTKWLLESPENVSGLLQILAPNLEKRLDFKRLHDEKKSFVLDTLRKQESDQVFLAPFKEETSGIEREIFIFILIEHQSKPVKSMGFRMLFYMTLIWDAQRRRWESDGVPESLWRFRPILPILFYTGERNWDTQLSIKELMDLPAELECFVPQHETLFLNLNATEPEKLTASGHPFGWILRIIQNESAPIEKLMIELKEAVENIDRLTASERIQWQRAMYYILLLIYHRRSPEEHEQLTDIVISKVQDRRRQEEVDKMGRTIAQALIA